MTMYSKRRVLVIAGSDSSGGAGLEADQRVIAAHGCYAMTATTALTAQNTKGVVGIHHTPPAFVQKQIDANIDDIGVDVVKTGMLASAETIHVVADALKRHKVTVTVVDPVMVATTGAQLLPHDAVQTLITELLPVTTILTPNISEAQLLAKEAGKPFNDIGSLDEMKKVAESIASLGPKYVLLKGGHLPLSKDGIVANGEADRHVVVNVLYGEGQTWVFESDYIESRNTHGTGCSLASAIASNIACGLTIPRAVKAATQYVAAGIELSEDLGKGSGPINHLHSTYTLPFAPGHFIDYLLDRDDVRPVWHKHTHHEFVQRLGDGTLPLESFKHYLIQDYHYLIHFARANAVAAYKATNLADISAAAANITYTDKETSLHLAYCTTFSLSLPYILSQPSSLATTAYSRWLLDTAHSSSSFVLQLAFLPCVLGYYEIANRLYNDPSTVRGEKNRYWKWIESYVAEEYVEAVRVAREGVERAVKGVGVREVEEGVRVFGEGCALEVGFWEMGLRRT